MTAFKKLAIAAMLGGASLAAHAATPLSASASIDWSSFTVSIYDINPLDGETPSVNFSDASKWSGAYNFTNLSSVASSDYRSSWTPTPALSAISSFANGYANAGNSDSSISSNANMTAPLADVWNINSYASKSANFTINGMAAVVFSAHYSLIAHDDNLADDNRANASVIFYSGLTESDGTQYGYSQTSAGITDGSKSGTLRLAFVNTDGTPMHGYFGANATAQVGASVAPVPEPSEYLMMLSGLGLVGFAVRRRKQ
ncbi:PEP-CTERM sorting domain-containing protein [Chitinivorax sp. PXF-14]|uniref:PEP-CTERM sorting domain-containing protein n=1 Tax=Chitinivorax sp. PXF-14 TaxID=3230488 RepID=UPI00346710C2